MSLLALVFLSAVIIIHGKTSNDTEHVGRYLGEFRLIEELEALKLEVKTLNNKERQDVQRLNSEVTFLRAELQSKEQELNAMNSTQRATDSKLLDFIRNQARDNVAFQVTQINHPFTIHGRQIFKFDRVVLNNGNGYHRTTGVFQAPVSGTYLFWANVLPIGGGLHITLRKEGHVLTVAVSPTTNEKSSLTYMTEVKRGEKVWFESYPYIRQIYGHKHSDYGGSLIHAH